MKDLESIIYGTHNEETRKLVREVVECYQVGAYRASLVSLWVAVILDIKNKLNELKPQENSKNEFRDPSEDEGDLVKQALKQKIISMYECAELQRIKNDRNFCAHLGIADEYSASLFVPEQEKVRAHLVAADRILFSQPPLSGRIILYKLDEQLKQGGNLDKYSEEEFYSEYFEDKSDSLKYQIIRKLCQKIIDTPPKETSSNGIHKKLKFCIAKKGGINQEKLWEHLFSDEYTSLNTFSNTNLLKFVSLFSGCKSLWKTLDYNDKGLLINRISSIIRERFRDPLNNSSNIDYRYFFDCLYLESVEEENSLLSVVKRYLEECENVHQDIKKYVIDNDKKCISDNLVIFMFKIFDEEASTDNLDLDSMTRFIQEIVGVEKVSDCIKHDALSRLLKSFKYVNNYDDAKEIWKSLEEFGNRFKVEDVKKLEEAVKREKGTYRNQILGTRQSCTSARKIYNSGEKTAEWCEAWLSFTKTASEDCKQDGIPFVISERAEEFEKFNEAIKADL
ncbi:hypothetical protein ACN08Z_01400 [Rothia sp. P7181]|uniref:hypothetical protein n=1 Tax=Rothia sp. P7181 TaxID=3402663 RepID=UPI003AE7D826